MYRLTDFDYETPKAVIAQSPLTRRDASRLMVLHKDSGNVEHRHFHHIVRYLRRGDIIVLNDTRVLPARLIGRRKTGGIVEALLLNETTFPSWKALLKAGSRLQSGERLEFGDVTMAMVGTVLEYLSDGSWVMSFAPPKGEYKTENDLREALNRLGKMPLPHYIKRSKRNDPHETMDRERYQTVFAEKTGAIAAPTAGLHFTKELLAEIKEIGVEVVFITLHVGIGTFRPIKANDFRRHVMDAEYYEVSDKAAHSINKAKTEGRRIIGVGTTSCRVLETVSNVSGNGEIKPSSGWTSLFIFPPYEFKAVDAFITNFHQPRSTMLLMVSAFAGRDNILTAYETAKNNGYRFYSYGDSMMII